MNDETFCISDIRKVGEKVERIDKPLPCLQPAFNSKTYNPSKPALQVLDGQRMTWMVFQPRIVHPGHQRMRLQELGNMEGILTVFLDPQREGLQSLEEEKGIEGTQRCAQITEQLHSDLDNEGHVPQPREIPKGVPEPQPVITGVRVGKFREFPVAPVKFSRIDTHAPARRPMATDLFRC